ncbi:MAG: hypothetical protein B7X37_02070 [Halothiobacillus sp. 14-55-98]|nr:MAG: hypothetical protein B7X37_02070 [Halothiobacillus sp. 14-55-98]
MAAFKEYLLECKIRLNPPHSPFYKGGSVLVQKKGLGGLMTRARCVKNAAFVHSAPGFINWLY